MGVVEGYDGVEDRRFKAVVKRCIRVNEDTIIGLRLVDLPCHGVQKRGSGVCRPMMGERPSRCTGATNGPCLWIGCISTIPGRRWIAVHGLATRMVLRVPS